MSAWNDSDDDLEREEYAYDEAEGEADGNGDDDAFDADDDGEPTIACPYCRRQIHEDSLRCPYCERYLSDEDAPAQPKPWWLLAGIIACGLAIYYWIAAW